jgi:hypothetical protein
MPGDVLYSQLCCEIADITSHQLNSTLIQNDGPCAGRLLPCYNSPPNDRIPALFLRDRLQFEVRQIDW